MKTELNDSFTDIDTLNTARPDNYLKGVPKLISAKDLKALSKINPLVSSIHILFEWCLIITSIWLCMLYWHPLLYIFTVVLIGSRQHALGILMHDSAHYRLFGNRKLNDIISELFLAWPLFITMASYRKHHNSHHRHVNSTLDPDRIRKVGADWDFPQSSSSITKMLIKDMLGINVLQMFTELFTISKAKVDEKNSNSKTYKYARLSYYLGLVIALTYFNAWLTFLLFWFIPIITWLKMVMRIRSIAEHFATQDDNIFNKSRTTYPSLFEKMFVCSKNINFHLDHHLYPSVPFYNLKKLHSLLLQSPQYKNNAHISKTYLGVLKECVHYTKQTEDQNSKE